jgi:hypothetical protein
MAYETVLNYTPNIASVGGSTVTAAGYASTIKLAASATTLGAALPDEDLTLTVRLSANSDNLSLSASSATSITLTLSSPTAITTPQVWPGVVVASTFKPSTSATVTVSFPQRSLLTTSISLSANVANTVLDPTKTTVVDNFFYLTGSSDANHQVRTTGGHANLQAYLG